jgi:hypothetical protein
MAPQITIGIRPRFVRIRTRLRVGELVRISLGANLTQTFTGIKPISLLPVRPAMGPTGGHHQVRNDTEILHILSVVIERLHLRYGEVNSVTKISAPFPKMFVLPVVACSLILTARTAAAQYPLPSDAWLMRNYRFTGPPPASQLQPVDPVVAELRDIQNMVWSMVRKADFEGDYGTALAAASQAFNNAQLIGVIKERLQASNAAAQAAAAEVKSQVATQTYLIALKDKTIDAATTYWVSGPMLNYVTLQGSHVIIRMDLVDRDFSRELNRQRGVEFNLP